MTAGDAPSLGAYPTAVLTLLLIQHINETVKKWNTIN